MDRVAKCKTQASKQLPDNFQFKIVVVGDPSSGKSAVIRRYVDNKFIPGYKPRDGSASRTKNITLRNKQIKIDVWDTAGQERYRSLTQSYFRGAHGCILVYNIKNEMSFDALTLWIKEARKYTPDYTHLMLVATCCDDEVNRKISQKRGEAFANELEIPFMETSAEKNVNIDTAFELLIERICDKQFSETAELVDSISLASNTDTKGCSSKCVC